MLTGLVDSSALRALLDAEWGVRAAGLEPLSGGMNSRSWKVAVGDAAYVAKLVSPAGARSFVAGLHSAGRVAECGIPTGPPLPTRSGQVSTTTEHGVLALLTWVSGSPLAGTTEDANQIGDVLGRVHACLEGFQTDAPSFGWVDAEADHLDAQAWVRPAIRHTLETWDAVRPHVGAWGLLHGDPEPEAFLRPPDMPGCGLIDWGGVIHGPLMYDVASAVMYVGTESAEPLVSAYLEHGPLRRQDTERALAPMLLVRWAVQADYFSRRLVANDLTGIDSEAENLKGLDDARRHLT